MEDQVAEPGEEVFECPLHHVTEPVPLGVPVALLEVIGGVLDEARHHRLPRGGHIGVDVGLDAAVDVRLLRVPPVLGVVEGPLQIVQRRAHVDEAAVLVRPALQAWIGRVGVEGEVDLGRGSLELEAPDVLHEIRGELPRVDEIHERPSGVHRADHGLGLDLGAVLEHDSRGPPVLGHHVVDRGLEPDLGAERLRRPGQDLGEPAVPSLVECPRPIGAVVLPEGVIEQHQTGPLGAGADLGADDARGRE